MGTTTDDNLRLELPDVGADDSTWGTILNDMISALELALTGNTALSFTASDITLSVTGAFNEQARNMVLDCSGALAANVNIIAPNEPKLYLVKNGTTDGGGGPYTFGIKTSAGSALSVAEGDTLLVWCDGSDVFGTINANISGVVALATNALQLGGVVAANYGQFAVKNTWTKPQVVIAVQASLTTDAYTPNADTESVIVVPQSEITANDVTINNPTGTPVDGQILLVEIEQHASTPVSVIWGSEYVFPDDTNIDLTQTVSKVDGFTFKYSGNLDRWLSYGSALNFPRT